jgi:hypothetical protein
MGRVYRRLTVAAVVVVFLIGEPGRSPAPAQPAGGSAAVGATTERLLKEAKLDYRKLKDGAFRVLIESKGEITPVVVEERKARWKDNKGNDVLYAYIWCEVVSMPADFKAPNAMLMRLAELNDKVVFCSIGIGKNPDGGMSVYRNSSVFLRTADAEELSDLLAMAHFDRVAWRKEFRGFVEEGK